MKGRELMGGILLGAIVGAALGLLLAPQSGEDTREAVRDRARELGDKMRDGSRQFIGSGRDLLEQGKSHLSEMMKRGAEQAGKMTKSTEGTEPEA